MKQLLPWVLGLLAIVLIVTVPARDGELLNYDDERYIASNPWLQGRSSVDGESIWTAYFDGHYHPLTLLSLKVDSSFGDNPIAVHHSMNWLLHGANSVALFVFLFLLTGNRSTALAVALLWGVHPLAVESYAWMTERKNVLYTLFFLLSAIQYLRFLRRDEKLNLIFTGVFFILSCLSKGQGVLLLPVFYLIDYVENGKINLTFKLKEKIPFLVLAIIFVLVGRMAQADAWDLDDQTYAFGERIFLGSYAFVAYILHSILPVSLSPYYPYPADVGESLSALHYAAPLGVVAYLFAVYKAYQKGAKLWFFGLAWFLVNVVLLLKILPVPFGAYLMADRYTYVPLMGLLLPLIAEGIHLMEEKIKARQFTWVVIGLLAVVFSLLSRKQIENWRTSVNLWTEVTNQYSQYPHAYNMLALGAIAENDLDLAFSAFNELNLLKPESAEAPVNMALLYERSGESAKAEDYLNIAIDREPESALTLEKSALLYLRWGNVNRALEASSKGVELYPEATSIAVLHSQVLARKGELPAAIEFLSQQEPTPEVVDLLSKLKQLANSAQPSASGVQMSETEQSARMYMSQAIEESKNGNTEVALSLFNKAVEADPNVPTIRVNRASFYARLGEFEKAEEDYLKALEIQPNTPVVWNMLGILYTDMGRMEEACRYYLKASEAGIDVSPQILQGCREMAQ